MRKILYFLGELKATFWFIPLLLILLAVFFAIALVHWDSQFSLPDEGLIQYIYVRSAGSARSILMTISGAMIGVAGTVFSITLVALTLASSQLGPRLVKNFMYDRLNQIVLGSYVATFIYCLIVLSSIRDDGELLFIPAVSVTVAILITLVNIFLLIIFIHHIAVSIQADYVISDISGSLFQNIKHLFPEDLGVDEEDVEEVDVAELKNQFKECISIKSDKYGYLRYIDNDTLMNHIEDMDALIQLHIRPGGFLVTEAEIGTLFVNEVPDEEKIAEIRNQLIIGKSRTKQQDAEYSIHQMVEIASRALSPGVNDPFTAIAVVDNLTSTMAYLTKVKFPSKYRYDQQGQLRIIADTVDYEGMLAASFNQIRQYAAGSPSVLIRLMEALVTIYKISSKDHQMKAIIKHAKMVHEAAKTSFKEENDMNDIQARMKEIVS